MYPKKLLILVNEQSCMIITCVVEDIIAVDSTIVHLILEQSEKKMISNGISTRRRLRSSENENPLMNSTQKRRMKREPLSPLLIPILHFALHRILHLRVVVEALRRRVMPEIGAGAGASGVAGGEGFEPGGEGGV